MHDDAEEDDDDEAKDEGAWCCPPPPLYPYRMVSLTRERSRFRICKGNVMTTWCIGGNGFCGETTDATIWLSHCNARRHLQRVRAGPSESRQTKGKLQLPVPGVPDAAAEVVLPLPFPLPARDPTLLFFVQTCPPSNCPAESAHSNDSASTGIALRIKNRYV